MTEAHAIDIEKCTECPFVGEHTRDDATAQCLHPAGDAPRGYADHVYVFDKPPPNCPLRKRPTLLRVTS